MRSEHVPDGLNNTWLSGFSSDRDLQHCTLYHIKKIDFYYRLFMVTNSIVLFYDKACLFEMHLRNSLLQA